MHCKLDDAVARIKGVNSGHILSIEPKIYYRHKGGKNMPSINLTNEQLERVRKFLEDEVKKYSALDDYVGHNVFIRTVTMYYTGHVEKISGKFMILSGAAWVADTGRFSDALKTGNVSEVEPMGDTMVNIDSIIDISSWRSNLLIVQK